MLSPILFSVYLDDLLEKLRVSGVGCYLGGCFAGDLSYAGDTVNHFTFQKVYIQQCTSCHYM